jgi:hypothetical protein
VALLVPGTTDRVCDFGNVASGASPYCIAYLGSSSGYLEVWYDWQFHDTIGFDAR